MTTTALTDLVHVMRSKNAGPTQLTLDLFFRDAACFEQARLSPALSVQAISHLYGCAPTQMQRFEMADIHALKFSLPRTLCAGDLGDGDVYGAQQHGPLLGIRV